VLEFGYGVKLRISDDIAQRLSAAGTDVSRRALEAVALEAVVLEGYRDRRLSLYQVSELLGLSRIETEDFLGQHCVPLSTLEESDLNREAAIFDAASCRRQR
jgi:predicted HTH domain antitoxin